MSWPPSPSLPAAIAQFLAAPLPPSPPAPFCVTPAHGGTATLRDMSEPEYMHGVPTGACREEPPDAKLQARADELARSSTTRHAASAVEADRSAAAPQRATGATGASAADTTTSNFDGLRSAPCVGWQQFANGSANDPVRQAVVNLWLHVRKKERLPKKSKKDAAQIALVVTSKSPLLEPTLRPSLLQLSSAPSGSGRPCARWSAVVRADLLPSRDLYGSGGGKRKKGRRDDEEEATPPHASCAVVGSAGSVPPAEYDAASGRVRRGYDAVYFVDDGGKWTSGGGGGGGAHETLRVLGATRSRDVLLAAANFSSGGRLVLDVRSKEALAGLARLATEVPEAPPLLRDPSVALYAAALWEAAALPPPAPKCLSAAVSAVLLASLMCERVALVGLAPHCAAGRLDADDGGCELVNSLAQAGVVCIEKSETPDQG
jgi:hypothetical protein